MTALWMITVMSHVNYENYVQWKQRENGVDVTVIVPLTVRVLSALKWWRRSRIW